MQAAPFAFAPPGRALCRFRLTEAEAQARFGAPHYLPDGPRSLPAWGFELPCGLLFEVQLNAAESQVLLHAELRELEHAVRHLDIDDRILWRMDEDPEAWARALEEYHPCAWGRWTVARRTEEDDIEPVVRCLSPADARCRADALQAAGEEVLIEEEPLSKARARRHALAQTRPAKRQPPERADRWEVWIIHPDGAQSMVQLCDSAQQAEQQRATFDPGEGRVELRKRD